MGIKKFMWVILSGGQVMPHPGAGPLASAERANQP
jgi:hypothetical protein